MVGVICVVLLSQEVDVHAHRSGEAHELDVVPVLTPDGFDGLQGEGTGINLATEEVSQSGGLLADLVPDHFGKFRTLVPVVLHCLEPAVHATGGRGEYPRPSAH